jgi:hypothetical protein
MWQCASNIQGRFWGNYEFLTCIQCCADTARSCYSTADFRQHISQSGSWNRPQTLSSQEKLNSLCCLDTSKKNGTSNPNGIGCLCYSWKVHQWWLYFKQDVNPGIERGFVNKYCEMLTIVTLYIFEHPVLSNLGMSVKRCWLDRYIT